MEDPFISLGDTGWPAKLIAAAFTLFGVVRLLADLVGHLRTLVRPPVKSEREILSEDQSEFLDRLMRRLEAVEAKLEHCEANHAQMARTLNQVLETAKLKGVELAMDLGSIAPIPAFDPTHKGDHP